MLFGSVDRTMLTLYVCITEGCSMDVVKPMVYKTPWVAAYWFLFIFITSFGILNIIIGLMCDSVLTAAQENEAELEKLDEAQRLQRLERLNDLFHKLDIDGSNTISRNEFMVGIS